MQGVDFVFSVPVLKQVPSCEFCPLEAVATNVLGTANTIDAAISLGEIPIIVLSTGKAEKCGYLMRVIPMVNISM